MAFGFTNMNEALPVYVTRPTANGETSAYSVSLWMPLLTMFLFFLNAILWVMFGLAAVGVVAYRFFT